MLFTSTDGRERASALTAEAREALGDARLVDATGRIRVERVKEDGLPLGPGEVRALRVAAGGTDLARLVCVRLDRPITEDDVHALERVAIVAALLITRQSAVSAVENKYQGDFLRDLLRAWRRRRVLRRGARVGVRLDARPARGRGGRRDRPAAA